MLNITTRQKKTQNTLTRPHTGLFQMADDKFNCTVLQNFTQPTIGTHCALLKDIKFML
jgi:hypothetical protein